MKCRILITDRSGRTNSGRCATLTEAAATFNAMVGLPDVAHITVWEGGRPIPELTLERPASTPPTPKPA